MILHHTFCCLFTQTQSKISEWELLELITQSKTSEWELLELITVEFVDQICKGINSAAAQKENHSFKMNPKEFMSFTLRLLLISSEHFY